MLSFRTPRQSNNTLEDKSCPNAYAIKKEIDAWRDTFAPPIADRLNAAAPGAHLNNNDVVQLMPLCAFETLFHGKSSPFCDMFTFEEFEAHEYYDDLSKFYLTGYVSLWRKKLIMTDVQQSRKPLRPRPRRGIRQRAPRPPDFTPCPGPHTDQLHIRLLAKYVSPESVILCRFLAR